MAEPTDSTAKLGNAQPGIERAKMIVNEITSAAQTAAMSLVDEQKSRAADRIGAVADALRAAARTLERSQSPVAAQYADTAARQVEQFVENIRRRHWTEIAADLDEIAKHRPVRFIAGAVLCGFVAGRLLSAPRRVEGFDQNPSRPAEGTVTAAVASASGGAEPADRPLPSEAQDLP
jgi:hypothetical protein